MKDEFNGVKIAEFVGLKSKMYSLISDDNKEVNKAKRINKKLRHKEYLDVLFNKKIVRHNMNRIISKLHVTSTYDVYKISLSCFDDKKKLKKKYKLSSRVKHSSSRVFFYCFYKNNKFNKKLMKIISSIKD